MLNENELIHQGQQVLQAEAQAIMTMSQRLSAEFVQAIRLVMQTRGRVICTGMGKPGYIAHKLAATLMSTGTPAVYLHPAEAIHGDLGMITQDDVVIAISNSGETAEILAILPTIKRIGAPLITICGQRSSTLAAYAQAYLDAHVTQEACELNLAPTSSTTAQLAMGDALAMVIMQLKQFSANDFAFYHPGGNLGQRRLLTIAKLLERTGKNPQITPDKKLADALFEMTAAGVGAVAVVDDKQHLIGIITDGDIRRQLTRHSNLLHALIAEVMTPAPTIARGEQLAADALLIMERHQPRPITVLPVVDDRQRVIGMLHLTDLLQFKPQST